jgi:hypothetical protein
VLIDGLWGRPLAAVADAVAAKGVKSPQNSYGYDYNGNLISDSGKGMTAANNHLNLPREITVQSSNDIDPGGIIQWTYNAKGRSKGVHWIN